MTSGRALPKATPETRPFWEAAKAGTLVVQRCSDCIEYFFPPRRVCPWCLSFRSTWVVASGRATLVSYVINHRPAPGLESLVPYNTAVVRLEEGVQMLTTIVGVAQTTDDLVLDMRLTVVFEPTSDPDIVLPQFRPATAA